MAYPRARPDWKGFPDTSTPINEDDLDHIEDGIVEAHVLAEAAQAAADSKETPAGAQAKANAALADAIQRANHTGTQDADTITDGTVNKVFTATEKTKLAGVATGATANSSDAFLRARANHTGTESVDNHVDGTTNKVFTAAEKTKLAGMTASFTTADETKLDGIEANADVTDATNVHAAGALMHLRWNGSSWPARPTGAAVPLEVFTSTDDPAADVPADVNLQVGDIWITHEDQPA